MDVDLSSRPSGEYIIVDATFNIGGTDIPVKAVWDTGATCTVINERLVPSGITPESQAPTFGASDGNKNPNQVLRSQYRANISIGGNNFLNVLVRSMPIHVDALIGMNIIRMHSSTLDGTGFSFTIE